MGNEEQIPPVAKEGEEVIAPATLISKGSRSKMDMRKFRQQQKFTPATFARFIYRTDPVCFFLSAIEIKARLKNNLTVSEETIKYLMADPEFAGMKEQYRTSMPDKFWALLSHWVESNLRKSTPSLREGAEILGEVTKQYMKGKTPQKGISEEQKKKFSEVIRTTKTA
mgnify:CR=1 FL=1